MAFSHIPDGLRLLRSGKQVGKIVFQAKNDDEVLAIPPPRKAVKLHADATYIIVGGFGGLGQHIAKWMAQRGARTLVFLSRSGADHVDARKVLEEIATEGGKGIAYKCDICDLEQVEATMKAIATDGLPVVRGIVQAAMALAVSSQALLRLDSADHLTGFNVQTNDSQSMGTEYQNQGPWLLEYALYGTRGVRLLHYAFVSFWCCWVTWPGKLCSWYDLFPLCLCVPG